MELADLMGNPIVKLEGKYLVWSTVCDAPVTPGMTLGELEEYVRFRYGQQGLADLPARLARVEAKGTSSMDDSSAEETIWLNRAGADETCLSRSQIVALCSNCDDDSPRPHGVKINETFSFEDWEKLP